MKKLLGLLLAAVVTLPSGAAIIKNVDITGEIQTIASDVKNSKTTESWYYNYNRGAKTRALAGLSFDVVADVRANVLFQYAYMWGDNNYTNTGFESAKGMKLAEANLVFSNLFGALEATIGRQFYGDENSTMIYFGPNHYNAERMGYARTLDGATFVYANDTLTATVMGGRIGNPFEADWDMESYDLPGSIFGADLKLNLAEDLTAQVYGYDWLDIENYQADGSGYVKDNHAGFYGAKLAFTPEKYLLSAEYARSFGGDRLIKEHKNVGYFVKIDGAVKATEALTARGTFYLESVDFWNFGNYTPGLLIGHLLQERVDEYSYGTRMFNVGVDYKPSDPWTVSFDGYSFQNHAGSHAAAYEFDVTAKYNYSEQVQLFAGVGYVRYSKNEKYREHSYQFDKLSQSENYKGQLGMLVRF